MMQRVQDVATSEQGQTGVVSANDGCGIFVESVQFFSKCRRYVGIGSIPTDVGMDATVKILECLESV